MILIRRPGHTGWHTPTTTSYADEKSLQMLIAQSPELLPGVEKGTMAIVAEMSIPGVGYVDLAGVDRSGGVTLVECKLKANPEIRRQVIGQALAYAAGVWGMTYETFDQLFSASSSKPLAEQVRELGGDEWDEEEFRATVTDNLARGRFRLVIVVDAITDELRKTVLFLNQHTGADLQVLALELGYIADEGVEILVPQTYGQESTSAKAQKIAWDEARLFERLASLCSAEGLTVARELYERMKGRSTAVTWGNSPYAWMNFRMPVGGKVVSALCLGEWPLGRGVVSFSFEFMRGLVSNEALRRAADRLRTLSGAQAILATLEEKDYRQRPNFPIDKILLQPGAIDVIVAALDEVQGASSAGQ